MARNISALLYEARGVLGVGSQGALGSLLGSSVRSGQRWETGRSSPTGAQLQTLAALVYPRNADLAAEIASAIGHNLVSLGIVAPPAPAPPPPTLPAEDVVDAVVCAAADAIHVTPRDVRPALLAAFARARRLGLSVEVVEKALGQTSVATEAAGKSPSA